MAKKIALLILIGIVAHALEFGFGIAHTGADVIALAIGVPLLILYALARTPLGLSGRLKGAESVDSGDTEPSTPGDPVTVICAVLYTGVYLNVLLRLRPRDFDMFFELFATMSPVELFWLVAPITVFWWYRRFKTET